ncbi:protection of telomeres protein 1 [Lates japonicus]|uniref:Protection of telomeres protein 1 n=1 Tax=Lates japonicus TaxID=270547 RepID=A0AAD3MXX7_LATJO|nr:protection of telomeres protein 1 [Lates japonicus]
MRTITTVEELEIQALDRPPPHPFSPTILRPRPAQERSPDSCQQLPASPIDTPPAPCLGPPPSKEKEKLIANILVYDNHVEVARQLKPGDFLRIYNLRAIPGSSKVPGLTSSQSEEVDHLAFHLHGGTAYGRGIRVLPENSPDVQELKRTLEAFPEDDKDEFAELNDSELLDVWSTPPESLDGETVECSTERSCGHDLQPVTLSEVKRSDPGRVHHVRVQLRSYEPCRLHQALKLYCSKCTTMLEVPDDDLVSGLFSEASRVYEPYSPPPWSVSGRVDVPGDSMRALNILSEVPDLFRFTPEETHRPTVGYQNVVPVRSSGGHLTLLDLSAPFLFRGRKRFYGCKRCSDVALREPCAEGVEAIDEKMVAEALGVRLLRFVLLMKLELQDATDSLDVFLWRDAELFFGVLAEDAAANQEAQRSIHQTMDTLCPPEGSTGVRPWLDLCLTAYRAAGDEDQSQTCYQIRHTKPSSSAPPEPDPPEPPAGLKPRKLLVFVEEEDEAALVFISFLPFRRLMLTLEKINDPDQREETELGVSSGRILPCTCPSLLRAQGRSACRNFPHGLGPAPAWIQFSTSTTTSSLLLLPLLLLQPNPHDAASAPEVPVSVAAARPSRLSPLAPNKDHQSSLADSAAAEGMQSHDGARSAGVMGTWERGALLDPVNRTSELYRRAVRKTDAQICKTVDAVREVLKQPGTDPPSPGRTDTTGGTSGSARRT